jgi:hypothetical protein
MTGRLHQNLSPPVIFPELSSRAGRVTFVKRVGVEADVGEPSRKRAAAESFHIRKVRSHFQGLAQALENLFGAPWNGPSIP